MSRTGASLAAFPARTQPHASPLYRLVRTFDDAGQRRSAWYFASLPTPPGDRAGRYDVPYPRGTCHASDTIAAAVLEVTRGACVVDVTDLAARSLARLTVVGDPPRWADLTAPTAVAFGVRLDVFTGDDYRVGQAWAADLDRAGWSGLVGLTRHDPTGATRTTAVFGPAGAADRVPGWLVRMMHAVESDEVLAGLARHGVRVLAPPGWLPVDEPPT